MRSKAGWRIVVCAGVVLLGVRPAPCQVTTEEGASILVFPLVVADGERDTLIQVTSGSLLRRDARCFYAGESDTGCQREEFRLTLLQRQPTHWVASSGRFPSVPNGGPTCDRNTGFFDCGDAGIGPGLVPPAPADFRGHLICVQVDHSGAPVGGNALRGTATIRDLASGAASRYNAVGLRGRDANDGDDVLCLGAGPSDRCPTGAEYDPCPDLWFLGHSPEGTRLGTAGEEVELHTSLSVVPCAADPAATDGAEATVSLLVINEMEQRLSADYTLRCGAHFHLADVSEVFDVGVLGSDFAQTQVTPAPGSPGIIVMGEVERTTGAADSLGVASAIQAHSGVGGHQGLIVLPGGAVR